MEIRRTSADDPNSNPQRIDITRQNREAIQTRQPLPPKPAKADVESDPEAHAKAVRAAREQHRTQHQQRIANARLDYTANHAEARAKDIANARAIYNAGVEPALARRTENAAAPISEPASSDKLELSSASQRMAQFDLGSKTDDAARVQRVADLKQLYESGALNTSDLIARASYRMLGGE